MRFNIFFIALIIGGCATGSRDIASTMKTGDSPYCHINDNGYTQCNYATLKQCHRAVKFLNGNCSKNE